MNRRAFLAVAAQTPLVVGPSLIVAPSLVEASRSLSELDLRRYYCFLWSEHLGLARRMGDDLQRAFCHSSGARPSEGLLPPRDGRCSC